MKLSFALAFLLFSFLSFGQSDKELWKEAHKLNTKAEKLLDKGHLDEAQKLFYQAHEIYYVHNGLRVLAHYFIDNGNVTEGNRCFDKIITKLNTYNRGVLTLTSDGYSYSSTKEAILNILQQKAVKNYVKGDINIAVNSYKKCLEYDDDKWTLLVASRCAFYAEDRESLSEFTTALAKAPEKIRVNIKFNYPLLNVLDGKYTDAIPQLLEIESNSKGEDKMSARFMLALAYALNKETDKSEEVIKQLLKNIQVGKNYPHIRYMRGLNEITKGNYDNAIELLTGELTPKGVLQGYNSFALYKSYVARAEAYMLKKDFTKARENFEAALIYKSDYIPAQNGLAKLEGKIITERRTDKTPPVIILTEPTVTRGLKVTSSGFDVMFRGTASDPSGLKSVVINNTNVYAQENGSFWGTITLKEGINTVSIEATDIVGNTNKLEVHVEKNIAEKKDDIVPVVDKEAKNYALIIASQSYDDASIPSLENPVSDAVKLKLALKSNYSFSDDNIFTLFNPAVIDLKKKFAELFEIVQPEDNIIIFYAGHGIWVEKEKKGYWLLTDAKRNDVNTWFSNKLMLDLISKLPSRHTLLITDACFSGSVFKTRSLGNDAPPAMREMSEKISRVAITSGNDSEVPDESVFMKYLIKALSENKDKYLTAQKMFITQIIEAVMTETKTEPRYGTLELAGHVGGDFIFVKK